MRRKVTMASRVELKLIGIVELPFDEFWSVYPRKVGKAYSKKCFVKACEREKLRFRGLVKAAEYIVSRAKVFAKSPKGRGAYCPYPSTWLNQGRYDDNENEWYVTSRGYMRMVDDDREW